MPEVAAGVGREAVQVILTKVSVQDASTDLHCHRLHGRLTAHVADYYPLLCHRCPFTRPWDHRLDPAVSKHCAVRCSSTLLMARAPSELSCHAVAAAERRLSR